MMNIKLTCLCGSVFDGTATPINNEVDIIYTAQVAWREQHARCVANFQNPAKVVTDGPGVEQRLAQLTDHSLHWKQKHDEVESELERFKQDVRIICDTLPVENESKDDGIRVRVRRRVDMAKQSATGWRLPKFGDKVKVVKAITKDEYFNNGGTFEAKVGEVFTFVGLGGTTDHKYDVAVDGKDRNWFYRHAHPAVALEIKAPDGITLAQFVPLDRVEPA